MKTEEQTAGSDYGKERSWGYQELAILYFPHIKPDSATRQLGRWIGVSRELISQLTANGWKPGRKLLTPKQAACIFRHLGPPGC